MGCLNEWVLSRAPSIKTSIRPIQRLNSRAGSRHQVRSIPRTNLPYVSQTELKRRKMPFIHLHRPLTRYCLARTQPLGCNRNNRDIHRGGVQTCFQAPRHPQSGSRSKTTQALAPAQHFQSWCALGCSPPARDSKRPSRFCLPRSSRALQPARPKQ